MHKHDIIVVVLFHFIEMNCFRYLRIKDIELRDFIPGSLCKMQFMNYYSALTHLTRAVDKVVAVAPIAMQDAVHELLFILS